MRREKRSEIFTMHIKNPKFVKALLLLQNCIGNGSVMFRREFVLKHNLLYRDNMLVYRPIIN